MQARWALGYPAPAHVVSGGSLPPLTAAVWYPLPIAGQLDRIVSAARWRLSQLVDSWASPYEAAIRAEVLSPGSPPQGKRPPPGEYGDIPVSIWADWNVQAIRNAVMGHANGNFGPAGLLVEAMLADDRVQAATNGRIKGITRCEPVFEAGDDPQRQELAAELSEVWPELVPDQELEQMLVWSTHLGFALCELVWEAREDLGRWVPRIKPWHPLSVWYNVADRSYYAITTGGSIRVEPGDPKWLLFTPWGAYRGWLRGSVRSVAIPWIVRQFALRDMSRYSEKHGLPMLVAKVPAQAPSEDKARFFSSLRNLGAESNLLLPVQAQANGTGGVGWDIELLEAKDRSWQAFTELRAECDRAITLAVRGTNLTTEVDGGSYAASKTHQEEDADYAAADRKKLAQCLLKQLLRPYCLYNHGDANLAPRFQLVPPEGQLEPAEIAKVWSEAAGAVGQLEAGGWKVDRAQVAERLGLPLQEDAAEAEQDEDRPAVQLTPSDLATIVTVNEGRRSQGLESLKTPTGEDDPDGELTIAQFRAKREADPEQSAEERPPEEQQRLADEAAQKAAQFGLPPPPGTQPETPAQGGEEGGLGVEPEVPANEEPAPKPRRRSAHEVPLALAREPRAEECQERQEGGKFGDSTGACDDEEDSGEEAPESEDEEPDRPDPTERHAAARERYEEAKAAHAEAQGARDQAHADAKAAYEEAAKAFEAEARTGKAYREEADKLLAEHPQRLKDAKAAAKAELAKAEQGLEAAGVDPDLVEEVGVQEARRDDMAAYKAGAERAVAEGDQLRAAGYEQSYQLVEERYKASEERYGAEFAKLDEVAREQASRAREAGLRADDLKEAKSELARGQREQAKREATLEKLRAAAEDGDHGAVEKLQAKLEDQPGLTNQNLFEAYYEAMGEPLPEKFSSLDDNIEGYDFDGLLGAREEADRAERKVARSERALRVHEREVSRTAPKGNAEDRDGDGKTGDEEAEEAAERRVEAE